MGRKQTYDGHIMNVCYAALLDIRPMFNDSYVNIKLNAY